jgi:hypothetical protein
MIAIVIRRPALGSKLQSRGFFVHSVGSIDPLPWFSASDWKWDG